ncbi:MAG: exodeoxyribonuclease VII small subunit [Bdellovibrionales bacterium]|nr:exodeoxyribonuclease VII small subunit [Bdellovibrionales bacterium]
MAEKTESFEKALEELESIVEKLQSDQLPLDESISLFEKGTKLSKLCSKTLVSAEKKIDSLLSELQSYDNPSSEKE